MKKTKAASSKHGLLFFEDEPIMKQIHDELNLGHLISKKVKPLPETISLLISKLFKV
ncbi:hypothetical protein [Bacillus pacificus]|uniref:hypothetical protein n=1 Tax=Bacillus pacificus TaxID=2026187 RepID=UPI002E1CB818|nr:hypothetical protein [Bacillus pacificus]